MNARTICLAVLASLILVADALGQGSWNRRVQAVSATPSATSPTDSDVHAVFRVSLDTMTSTPLDLSTTVNVFLNGTLVGSHTIPVSVDPGSGNCSDGAACGGSCGSGAVDGLSQTMICVPDGPCTPQCDCVCAFPPITWTLPGQPLRPKDEIMVLLMPGPGAFPDPDSSDDQMMITYQEPVFWDRQITSIDLQPTPGAPGLYEITAGGTVFYSGVGQFGGTGAPVPLDVELDLVVDGLLQLSATVPFQPLPLVNTCGCGNVCGSYEGLDHTCLPSWGGYCHCGWPWLYVFSAVPVDPGDEITVILRPAPGALPELPGFEEEDEESGATGVEEITLGARERLEPNRPNPFRGNTTIIFDAPATSDVTLEVFDVRGRRVRTLLEGKRYGASGRQAVGWDGLTGTGERAPAGVYFVRLQAGEETYTRKMTRAH